MDIQSLRARAVALLENKSRENRDRAEWSQEIIQGTLTLMNARYGSSSQQVTSLLALIQQAQKEALNNPMRLYPPTAACRGALENLVAEIDAGLHGSLQLRITGEVLTDLIRLARSTLDEAGDAGVPVAGVLAAAAYEDTLRRLVRQHAPTLESAKLSEIITALKDKDVLRGPQVATAQGYLTFRNNALHAKWDNVDRPVVGSVLGFVEGLLLSHFV